MNLKLLLLSKVPKLGQKGDVVEVKKGYARNFLLPQSLARPITLEEIKKIEVEKKREAIKLQEQLKSFKDIKEQLATKRISLQQKASSTGKLYAAVSPEDISVAIYQTYGFRLPKEAVKAEPIKSVGLHRFKVMVPNKQEIPMKIKVRAK